MIDYQSFYQAQLTSGISDTATNIPLDNVPIPSEGFLVIEPNVPGSREIIYFTSKDGTSVTVPSGVGLGRGFDGTTAVPHLQNADVIMAPIGMMFKEFGEITADSFIVRGSSTANNGWTVGLPAPNTVTANGNRSYDLVFNGTDLTDTVSEGMRLRTTRTVSAPTQCASLNGSTQYFNRTSPSGMTFTDDFVVSAWVKLSSYSSSVIASRYNGTSGWGFVVQSDGTVSLRGFNASNVNFSRVDTFQSLPLNKWVHVAAQLDMSAFSVAGTTNSYIMIDGVAVPANVTRGGTNPTSLLQGTGSLEIGSWNGGTSTFSGKIAQVAIYSAKVTQDTIRASMSQGLTGSETSLISAYSLNNSINDLSATGNNLTAQNSALATNVDSPFGSYLGGTLDYGIITKTAFSTNTTLTVQVPEGCTIPTSGGVSAVAYSTQAVPYLFPDKSRFGIGSSAYASVGTSQTTTSASPTDLSTYGPYATVWVGPSGKVQVSIAALMKNSTVNFSHMVFAIDGTAVSLATCSATVVNTNDVVSGRTIVYDGLAQGWHTFTAKYYTAGGTTGTYQNRTISVASIDDGSLF
jgi:hypothetical protein